MKVLVAWGVMTIPKLTWMDKRKGPPKVNRLEACLKMYKKAAGLTAAQIAERLGISEEAVRQQMRRPADAWRIGTLRQYCEVLGCPFEEAIHEATK